ncbi:MAG: hypothetical protein ACRET8_09710 [Burkholderiales bacterium]
MLRHALLATLLASLAVTAHADDGYTFKLAELMQSDDVKGMLDPPIQLLWGEQPTPQFAEVTRLRTYTRSGVSLSIFGGSRRHCVEAFDNALQAMIRDARARGYDAVIDVQVKENSSTTRADAAGFRCKPGYKTTEVPVSGRFAMTAAAFERMREADASSASLPPRPPAEDAIFVPLEPVIGSEEEQAMAGPAIRAYWGIDAPPYADRYGPETYKGAARIGADGKEAACRQAVLGALKAMAGDAKSRAYDAVIRIRSYFNERYAPKLTEVECEIDKDQVGVVLQASLATRKPGQ